MSFKPSAFKLPLLYTVDSFNFTDFKIANKLSNEMSCTAFSNALVKSSSVKPAALAKSIKPSTSTASAIVIKFSIPTLVMISS